MPYTDSQPPLPWNGRGPIARHCSYEAAKAKAPTRGTHLAKMEAYFREHGEATDEELSDKLEVPRQSICSLRGILCKAGKVVDSGRKKPGSFGLAVTIWEFVGD